MSDKPSIKTSLRLPEGLWQKAQIEAIKRRLDLQDIVAEALECYFKKGGKQ